MGEEIIPTKMFPRRLYGRKKQGLYKFTAFCPTNRVCKAMFWSE